MRSKFGRTFLALAMSLLMFSTFVLAACGRDPGEDPVSPTAVTIDTRPASDTLVAGETFPLKAVLAPSGAEGELEWASSDTAVATVSAAGELTAVAAGTSEISAAVKDTQLSDSFTLTVTAKPVEPIAPTSVTITAQPASDTMTAGEMFALKAALAPSGAEGELEWTSSDTAVATVSSLGALTAVAPGTSEISVAVKDTQLSDSFTLTVNAAEVPEEQPVQDYTEYTLEGYTAPLWKQSVIGNETVMFVGKDDVAELLYTPTEIISVRSLDMKTEYTEGEDYIIEGKTIKLTENTSIPY